MALSETGFVREQYDTSANLDARSALHARYSTNRYRWFRWVYDQFVLQEGDGVLELGCGTGALWAENASRVPAGVRLTLTDLTAGMVATASESLAPTPLQATFAQADAQSLPYPNGCFDVVIANHMLYHVPDRARALAEVARVLAAGGRFYATTIGEGHMAELHTLAGALGPGLGWLDGWNARGFSLEDGPPQVSAVLAGVEVRRYHSDLRITDVEPLLAYYDSLGSAELAPHREALRVLLQAVLDSDGVIRIHKDPGMILAHKH